MTYPPPVIRVLLLVLAVAAGLYDIRSRRIPNWLTVSGALTGLAVNTFLYEAPGFWLSAKGLGLALLIYFPLFLLRAMGAGDAKLMAAVGSLLGPANWLGVFFLSALLGGFSALILVMFRGRFQQTLANMGGVVKSLLYFQAPYTQNEALDFRSPKALTFPHGAVVALGCIGFLAAGAVWAPR